MIMAAAPMPPVTSRLSVRVAIMESSSSSSPVPPLLPLSPFIRREPKSFSDFTMFPWEGLYQNVVTSPSSSTLILKHSKS